MTGHDDGTRSMTMKCKVCGFENSFTGKQGAVAMLVLLDKAHDMLRPDCEVAKQRAGAVQ